MQSTVAAIGGDEASKVPAGSVFAHLLEQTQPTDHCWRSMTLGVSSSMETASESMHVS